MAKDERAVTWIAHRGYQPAALENTAKAFAAAIAQGFTNIETDLRATADGHIVLTHDALLKRLGGPEERPVHAMTRAELEAVRLSDGSPLVFFEEFVERFAAFQWIFDIKPESGREVIRNLTAWCAARGTEEWLSSHARFLCWQRGHQEELAAKLPRAHFLARQEECWRAGLAVLGKVPWAGGLVAGRTYALPARLGPFELYQANIVAAYQSRGARVLAFLPANQRELEAALAAGVDEVLTDFGKGGV